MKKYASDGKISVKPFKITISQEVLDDLKERLKIRVGTTARTWAT
jgi:hypothetical protein